jgi:hypothetical protein
MKQDAALSQNTNWITNVLTDIHFWVPVIVLVGGLLLLSSYR